MFERNVRVHQAIGGKDFKILVGVYMKELLCTMSTMLTSDWDDYLLDLQSARRPML